MTILTDWIDGTDGHRYADDAASGLAARGKSPNAAICSVPPSAAAVISGQIGLLRGTPGAETGRYRTFATGCYDAAGNVSTVTEYHSSVVRYTYTDRKEVSTTSTGLRRYC